MDRAIIALESVVKENPTHRDSLTLLGRAYYRKARYEDARQILRRAVAVNKEDEIAWLVLGMSLLRLGDNNSGLETLKGGITLVSKVAVSGYRDYPYWDINGRVRAAIRRTIFLATKGVDEKEALLTAAENLLFQIDEEENFQRMEMPREKRREYGA
jgi:tetratricopeptide (TPR) repeat protein